MDLDHELVMAWHALTGQWPKGYRHWWQRLRRTRP